MKKSDIKIVTNLRCNGRMPLTEMSKRTGLPVSTIHERLKLGIAKGVLKPTILFNFAKLGFVARACIFLSAEQNEKEKLHAYLLQHPNVNSLFRINNGWHVMMDCVFKDMHALENFVDELERRFHLRQKQVHYILDELKIETFLSTQNDAEVLDTLSPIADAATFK